MKTQTELPRMSAKQKTMILESALLFVLNGAKLGTIKSQAITLTLPDAEEFPVISLSEYIERAFKKAGIRLTETKGAA